MHYPELDRKGLRQFGLTTGAIVAVLFGLLLPWLFGHGWPLWPWLIAAVLVLMAWAVPKALSPVYKIWMRIGHALGWLNTRIILALVFYAVVFPIGYVMRFFGKDPMSRRLDDAGTSYRVSSENHPKDSMERPF